jgi:hypothetical protein
LIAAGLCDGCVHQRLITNTRGSTFSLCERGLAGERGYAKYPRLPVLVCAGHQPGESAKRFPTGNPRSDSP